MTTPKIIVYYSFDSGDSYKVFRNLEDVEALVFDEELWPILIHLAFEPPISSQICPNLLDLPRFPFVSQSMHSALLPVHCQIFSARYAEIEGIRMFPLESFLGRDLLSIEQVNTSSLEQIKQFSPVLFEDRDLADFYFSVRTTNVLNKENISTIKELISYKEKDLLDKENFGRKSLTEIITFLEDRGLRLGMEADQKNTSNNNIVQPFSPVLFEDRDLADFYFSVRTTNVLNKENISTIKELISYKEKDLLDRENFGRKSLAELITFLEHHGLRLGMEADQENTSNNNIVQPHIGPKLITFDNIIDEFDYELSKIEERPSEILKRRSGHGTPQQTLEEIGVLQSVTRERIRQLESKAIRKIKLPSSGWNVKNRWGDELERRFSQATYPLTLEYVKSNGEQFYCESNNESLLIYIFEKLLPKKYYTVNYSGNICIIRDNKEKLEETISRITDLLSKSEGQKVSTCFDDVKGIVPSEFSEFTTTLFNSCMENSITSSEDGEKYLRHFSMRHSALNVGREIFANSPCALSNEEISEIVTKKYPEMEIRNVQNRFQDLPGVFPFSHRSWGTLKHLFLSDNELLGAKSIIRQAVREIETDQFHSNDILESIQIGDPTLAMSLNSFKVAGLIREYCDIPYLGRSTFSKGDSKNEKRIILNDLVVRILKEFGHPMHSNEIKDKIREVRSFAETIQIQPKPPVVLLGAGIFALDDMQVKETAEGFLYKSKIDGQEKLIKADRMHWNSHSIQQLTELYQKGESIAKISKVMNRSYQTISIKLKEENLLII